MIKESYGAIQQFARFITADEEFQRILEDKLNYKYALDSNRPLSLADVLILLNTSSDHDTLTNLADELTRRFQQPRFRDYTQALGKQGLCPFEGFLRSHGLRLKSDTALESSTKDSKNKRCEWIPAIPFGIRKRVMATRTAILDFALHYAHSVKEPNGFDPYYLQQTSDLLNTSLRSTVNIINRDIEAMFMQTTLDNIREVVSDFNDVTYAQIGKTSIAGLSGLESSTTGTVESIFDVTPPLTMLELLKKASINRNEFSSLLPNLISPINFDTAPTPNTPEGNTEDQGNTIGGDRTKSPISFEPMIGGVLPLTSFLGLLSVYEEDRSQRLTLGYEGPNLTVTPHVLPNMSSAEIDFNLTVGEPNIQSENLRDSSGEQKEAERLVNLSKIKKHTANSRVYVDAVDFFTISTFSSQNSIDGGRGYVPVIGTIWRGVFSDIPIFGNLFSWKKDPQTVVHESMLLTNSYITPTVMGLTLKFPNDGDFNFEVAKEVVEAYKNRHRQNPLPSQTSSDDKSSEFIFKSRQNNFRNIDR